MDVANLTRIGVNLEYHGEEAGAPITGLLADLGRKRRASDHIHPTFNADSTKIEIQTAMLSEDDRSLNICIVPVPKDWLARTYR